MRSLGETKFSSLFNLLSDKQENQSVSIMEGNNKIWEITKRYDRSEFESNTSCVGYGIDVYQESINKTFREYLVNFPFLTKILEDFGFEPLSPTEAKRMKLPTGIGSFRQLYGLMEQEVKRNPDDRNDYGTAMRMTAGEKKISFLNQYFIYKKVRDVDASKVANMLLNQQESEELTQKMNTVEAQLQVQEVQSTLKPKVKRIRRKLVLKE